MNARTASLLERMVRPRWARRWRKWKIMRNFIEDMVSCFGNTVAPFSTLQLLYALMRVSHSFGHQILRFSKLLSEIQSFQRIWWTRTKWDRMHSECDWLHSLLLDSRSIAKAMTTTLSFSIHLEPDILGNHLNIWQAQSHTLCGLLKCKFPSSWILPSWGLHFNIHH